MRVLFFSLFLFPFILTAQSTIKFAPTIAANLSHTGIGVTVGATMQYNKWQAYLGPRYLLDKGAFGVSSSVYYFPNGREKRFNGFVNSDYHLTFLKANCSSGDCVNRKNYIHETTLGYGFSWTISEQVQLLNAVHIGGYWEQLYNHNLQERLGTSGFNLGFKLGGMFFI